TLSPTDACSGTTTTDGTHWFSYVEPQGGQPTIGGTIDFSAGFPSSGFGIYSSTNHYLTGNTAATGQVTPIPLNLSMVTTDAKAAGALAAGGVFEFGIACASSTGAVTDWWNFEVTTTKVAPTTDPNGFTWSAVAGPPGGGSTTTTSTSTSSTSTSTTSAPTTTSTSTTSTTMPATTTTLHGVTTTTTPSGSCA